MRGSFVNKVAAVLDPMNNDKVIVTNFTALAGKYTAEGVAKIKSALSDLITRDKADALTTQVIDISSTPQMAKWNGKPVTIATNQKQAKAAIDAIYKALAPAYIMILGSTDVVPHQDLVNPISDPEVGDPDKLVPSDLPYACDSGYSTDPTKFIGPTRVVGRLPDINGATRPDYLVKVLGISANRTARAVSDYASNFSISAWEWRASTQLSVQRLFGQKGLSTTSPQKGPEWNKGELGARAHFINCHGTPALPVFHGQKGESYPVAHGTKFIDGSITEGTIVAAECCYGGQLYDPKLSQNIMGICHAYLAYGAYGYCGSSTIAYGPEDDNAQADLICQYFLKSILDGASTGRAMLEARQKFAQGAASLNPYDLKTLVQFNLFGDPSVHPVLKTTGTSTKAVPKAFAAAAKASPRAVNREDRRIVLERIGQNIQRTQMVARKIDGSLKDASRKLRTLAAEAGLTNVTSMLSFKIESAEPSTTPRAKFGFAGRAPVEVLHIITERHQGIDERDIRIRALLATEADGQIRTVRKIVSR